MGAGTYATTRNDPLLAAFAAPVMVIWVPTYALPNVAVGSTRFARLLGVASIAPVAVPVGERMPAKLMRRSAENVLGTDALSWDTVVPA